MTNREKFLLHHYARAAQITEATYRLILIEEAGCDSAASPMMTQAGFEKAMATLEAMLFSRVAKGQVQDPRPRDRYIMSDTYWRRKLPRPAGITSRHRYRIEELWAELRQLLPPGTGTTAYLLGIVNKAVGCDAEIHQLSAGGAGKVIDALMDRLAAARRKATAHAHDRAA
jgi:hypothetical protein